MDKETSPAASVIDEKDGAKGVEGNSVVAAEVDGDVEGESASNNVDEDDGDDEGGKVTAAMDTISYGRVTAQFHVKNHTVSGYIACDTEDGTRRLQEREESLRAELFTGTEAAGEPLKTGSIAIVYSKESNVDDFAGEDQAQSTTVETADLYRIAKAFITSVAA